MRLAINIFATVLICSAVGIALHQILVYGGWEWDELLSVNHHEGIAVILALLGILLFLLSGLKRR